MRVRISYPVEATDQLRAAIRCERDEDGKATIEEVKDHYVLYGGAMDDDLFVMEVENCAHDHGTIRDEPKGGVWFN